MRMERGYNIWMRLVHGSVYRESSANDGLAALNYISHRYLTVSVWTVDQPKTSTQGGVAYQYMAGDAFVEERKLGVSLCSVRLLGDIISKGE